jgi:phospholipid/cholesterol/gamma-HCH transport system substrate-binding protein
MMARSKSFRVGLFVLLGVVALMVAVSLLGRQRSLFDHKLRLRAAFDNAAGLMEGSPVRLAGVNVGVVDKISFSDDLKQRRVRVVLAVSSRYAQRLRTDSVAQLSSKGLLGDAVVDLSVGSPEEGQLHDGDQIRTAESFGIAEAMRASGAAIEDVRGLIKSVRERVEKVVTDEVAADVGKTVHSLTALTAQAERGDSPVHTMLYDRQLAKDLRELGAGASDASTDLARTARELRNDLDQGRGTIGALLKDPTLYDDMKLLVGNAQRSRMLGALIRYTIRHDKLKAKPVPSAPKKESE